MKKWKVVFAGTPKIAVPLLRALIFDPRFSVTAIATQPDRPVGRHAIVTPSPVKVEAERYGIPVWQESAKSPEFLKKLQAIAPDFLITMAFGQILPNAVLAVPAIESLNIHASLLPKFRGASPLVSTILAGEFETGISLMRMEKTMDTGPVFSAWKLPIESFQSADTLAARIATLAAENIPNAIDAIGNGVVLPTPQNEKLASYCGKISRSDGEIHESMSISEVLRRFYAFTPWPGIFVFWNGKRIKLLAITAANTSIVTTPRFFRIEKHLFFGLADGAIEIETLQIEGKKPISASLAPL